MQVVVLLVGQGEVVVPAELLGVQGDCPGETDGGGVGETVDVQLNAQGADLGGVFRGVPGGGLGAIDPGADHVG